MTKLFKAVQYCQYHTFCNNNSIYLFTILRQCSANLTQGAAQRWRKLEIDTHTLDPNRHVKIQSGFSERLRSRGTACFGILQLGVLEHPKPHTASAWTTRTEPRLLLTGSCTKLHKTNGNFPKTAGYLSSRLRLTCNFWPSEIFQERASKVSLWKTKTWLPVSGWSKALGDREWNTVLRTELYDLKVKGMDFLF